MREVVMINGWIEIETAQEIKHLSAATVARGEDALHRGGKAVAVGAVQGLDVGLRKARCDDECGQRGGSPMKNLGGYGAWAAEKQRALGRARGTRADHGPAQGCLRQQVWFLSTTLRDSQEYKTNEMK